MVLKYVTKDGRQHPVLAVVDPQFVAGDWAHPRVGYTPTMMRQKAIELLRYGRSGARKDQAGCSKQDDVGKQCGETFNWRYQGVANGNGELRAAVSTTTGRMEKQDGAQQNETLFAH